MKGSSCAVSCRTSSQKMRPTVVVARKVVTRRKQAKTDEITIYKKNTDGKEPVANLFCYQKRIILTNQATFGTLKLTSDQYFNFVRAERKFKLSSKQEQNGCFSRKFILPFITNYEDFCFQIAQYAPIVII